MSDPRDSWRSVAALLVDGADRHATPAGALVHLGRPYGRDGRRVAGLEGFARSTLIRAFLTQDDAQARDQAVDRTLRAITAGLGEDRRERWPRPADSGQVLAEAAGLALALRVLGAWGSDPWPDSVRDRWIAFAQRALEVPAPPNNWRLFRLTLTDHLRSLGATTPALERQATDDAALVESLARPHGWFTDGGDHAVDYYTSYAFHFYGPLHLYLGARDRWGPPTWAELDTTRARLRAYVPELTALLDAHGRPVAYGRSLTYRWASATALVTATLLDALPGDPAAAQRSATACLRGFVEAPGVLRDGVLQPGWRGRDPAVLQDYSSTASSLWVGKLFAGLLLPPEHPFWDAPGTEVPAPPPASDLLLTRRTPAHVELYPLGTSALQRPEGAGLDEDPAYAHLGYSTVTEPLTGGPVRDMAVMLEHGTLRWRRGPVLTATHGPGWTAARTSLIVTRRGLPRRVAGRNLARLYRALRLPAPVTRAPHTLDAATVVDGDVAIHVVRWPDSLEPRGRLLLSGWATPGDGGTARTGAGVAAAAGGTLSSALGMPGGLASRPSVTRTRGRLVPTATVDAARLADNHRWAMAVTCLASAGDAEAAAREVNAALSRWAMRAAPDRVELSVGGRTWTVTADADGPRVSAGAPVSPAAP